MAFSFKLPKLGKSAAAGSMTVSADAVPAASGKMALPGFLAGQPVVQQMKTLGGIFAVLMLLIAALVFHDNRESTHGTSYVAASGEMRMLSQRLAKAAAQAANAATGSIR